MKMYCVHLMKVLQTRVCNIPRICYVACYIRSSSQYHPVKYLEAEDRWREQDRIPRGWELIYKAPMEKPLNFLTTFLTVSTGATVCGGVYYAAFIFDNDNLLTPVLLDNDVVLANSPIQCLVYIGAFIAFHIAVKVLLSKYVVRLYFKDDKYIAVFRGHMYNSIKKHEFHLKEFKKLKPALVVTWSDARFGLGEKHGIILEDYFKTPEHFNYLLTKKKAMSHD